MRNDFEKGSFTTKSLKNIKNTVSQRPSSIGWQLKKFKEIGFFPLVKHDSNKNLVFVCLFVLKCSDPFSFQTQEYRKCLESL